MTVYRRFWLVQVGEELPFDHGPPRLLRTALLARELAARGHQVTFWNATYNHQQKIQRSITSIRVKTSEDYSAILLAGRSYSRNVSLARIQSHRENAREFVRLCPYELAPDAILCGYPTLELADAATKYANKQCIPIAVDCRDMWPDIIVDQLNPVIGVLAKPIIAYWRAMQRRIMRRATAITGITDAFVEWGIANSGRRRSPADRAFHLAVPYSPVTQEDLQSAKSFWTKLMGAPTPHVACVCFGGTMSHRLDISTIVKAALELSAADTKQIRLVFCGKGDSEGALRQLAGTAPHIFFAGWRSAAELASLMSRSHAGLLPYPNTPDFLASFPNKIGEYLSASLPIMTGLEGITGELLSTRKIGIHYQVGNATSARDALQRIARRQATSERQRISARKTYTELFDPAIIYPAFADYIEGLANIRNSSRSISSTATLSTSP